MHAKVNRNTVLIDGDRMRVYVSIERKGEKVRE